MTKKYAAITGVHGHVPKDILTNKMLEGMVDTTDEWITTRTGIKQRHILKGEGVGLTDMAVPMVEGLLKKTNTSPDEIDFLVCATITGDHVFPDSANTICDKVGIKNAFGFDINAACSGFLFSLTTAAKMIESGMVKKAIVVGADVMSSIIDYTDRTTCVIFGDGGGAVMLEANDQYGLVDSFLRGDGSGRNLLNMKAGGSKYPSTIESVTNREHFVFQDGRPVFKAAVTGMVDAVTKVLDRNGLTIDDIQWLVPHQANHRIIQSVGRGLGIDSKKVMVNIHKYGNTTSGTLPLCLWEYEDQLKKGDKLVLTAFGGGFTWGATLLTWAYDS